LLEKKWISVVKLKKRVMELEDKLKQHTEGHGIISIMGSAGNDPVGDSLPRMPERYSLVGHRSRIT